MKQEDKGTVAISLVAYSVALATRRGVAAEPLLAHGVLYTSDAADE
nr:hypothetical protein [Burkholderia sp. LMG 13014]